jgi:hypothetical protein
MNNHNNSHEIKVYACILKVIEVKNKKKKKGTQNQKKNEKKKQQ